MLLKIILMFVSIILLKIPQKCDVKQSFISIIPLKIPQKCGVKQSPSMQPCFEFRFPFPIIQRHQQLNGYCLEEKPKRTHGPRSTPTNDKQKSKKPTAKRKTPICSVCEKTVRINSKRMIRTYCKLLTHLHCTNTKSLTVSDTKNTKEWTYFLALELSCCFTK